MNSDHDELKKIAIKLALPEIKQHIFLCVGEKCCPPTEGLAVWESLKEKCRAINMKEHGIYRTKVGCLRVCRNGPIAVVYPEGTWYSDVTKEACMRIVDEHLIGGRAVEELVFAKSNLGDD